MAFNALKQTRSAMIVPVRNLSSSAAEQGSSKPKSGFSMDWAPIALLGGFTAIVGYFAVHSLKQQLFHSPSVMVTKKMRECVAEVDEEDAVVKAAGKFEAKSFFRKIAHIQDKDYVPSTQQPNREVESLKSVGVKK